MLQHVGAAIDHCFEKRCKDSDAGVERIIGANPFYDAVERRKLRISHRYQKTLREHKADRGKVCVFHLTF